MSQPVMQAKEKLAESAYFLGELQRTASNASHFNYSFSAFMSANYSIMEIMLYDFAERYGLGFTREDWFSRDYFRVAGKAQKNTSAQDFLKWWDQKLSNLSTDPLWKMRQRIVHRETTSIERDYSVYVSGGSSRDIDNPRDVASIVAARVMSAQPPFAGTRMIRASTSPKIYLPAIPDRDLRDLCKELYDQMVIIVGEAEHTFWR